MKRLHDKKIPQKKKKEQTIYEKFFPNARSEFQVRNYHKKVYPSDLNPKQRKAFDIVEKSTSGYGNALRLLIIGKGGSGKSYIISALRTMFDAKNIPFRVLSFTGSAAFLAGGMTIHKCLQLGYNFRQSPPAKNITGVRNSLKKVKYYLIDELSLLGLALLGYFSLRLQAIHRNSEEFGGMNIVMLGDFSQLRSVCDKALYSSPENLEGLELAGALAYATFKTAVLLHTSMRQIGSEQQEFRDLLGRIREGHISDNDIKRLESRFVANISVEEQEEFAKDATFLFAEHQAVDAYNEHRLSLLGTEIHEIRAKDSKAAPLGVKPHVLRLAVGARIFVNKNLFVEGGIFNGCLGYVTDVSPKRDKEGFPEYIFIKPDFYIGPRFMLRNDVPITPVEYPEFDSVTKQSWTRKQIPLELAFGITVHKSQGCTLSRVVIGIPSGTGTTSLFFRNSPSIFYVCASRVRRFEHLALSQPFRPEVVNSRSNLHFIRWRDEEARLAALEPED